VESHALDDLITRLLKRSGEPVPMTEQEIENLCDSAAQIFLSEPSLLELNAPIVVCGDIHGQYRDLLKIFNIGGFPPRSNYLFLGDYVDRGNQSLETICLLLAYKVKYPQNFFLLRGNHEDSQVNKVFGFYDECVGRYKSEDVWKCFKRCFKCLPIGALIGKKILCVHGGISPELDSLDQIRDITRPVDVPESGLLTDLLWSDPCTWGNGWNHSLRGCSMTFGPDLVKEFTAKHGLDLICRAHQVANDGYEFFADGKLVTIFSAPCYMNKNNLAAIMIVDERLLCSYKTWAKWSQTNCDSVTLV
ncbi:hypothetical protein SELMODRAFT_117581, partial [Selaginella moellendorffii]